MRLTKTGDIICGVSFFVVWKDEACLELDEAATRDLLRRVVNETGENCVLVEGSEGEIHTTTRRERNRILEIAVQVAGGRVPVFGCVHASSLREQIETALEAKRLGASGLFWHIPLPLVLHSSAAWDEFVVDNLKRLDAEVDLPIIVRGSPEAGLSVDVISPHTFRKAAKEVPNFCGWKVISLGNMSAWYRCQEIMKDTQVRLLSAGSSEPTLLVTHMLGWAEGNLSGGSNFTAKWDLDVMRLARQGKFNEAKELADQLMPIYNAVYGIEPGIQRAGFIPRYKLFGWLAGLIPTPYMRYPWLPRPKEEVEKLCRAIERSQLFPKDVIRDARHRVDTYDPDRILKAHQNYIKRGECVASVESAVAAYDA